MTKEEKAKEYLKQYYLDNKEKLKEKNKQYRLDNMERLKEYRLDNKEQRNQYNKQWHLDNKGYNKQWHLNNKEKKREYNEKYNLENKEKINKYYKSRRDSEPLFKLTGNTRCLISLSLRNKGYTKKSKTYKILGCEYDFFANYLDLKNYNEDSHLDHVIPISLADTEEEVILLNHYSNFQLLPSIENIIKGNRYIKIENYMRVLHNHPNPKKLKEIVNRSNINIQ